MIETDKIVPNKSLEVKNRQVMKLMRIKKAYST